MQRGPLFNELLLALQARDDEELLKRATHIVRYGCVYNGTMTASDVPFGPWKHCLYVQTVNTTTANMKPTQAAQIIGASGEPEHGSPTGRCVRAANHR